MKDDLISREEAIEAVKIPNGEYPNPSERHGIIIARVEARRRIMEIPSVPAVPLDKLCEWLANSFSDPPCCTLENVRCEMECRGFTKMSECWRNILSEWMEAPDDR